MIVRQISWGVFLNKVDKVTIRLTPQQASAIDRLVEGKEFKNRSDVIREAVDALTIEEIPPDPNEVRVVLDDWVAMALHGLVGIKRYQNMDTAVSEMLKQQLLSMNVDEIKAQIEWLAEWGERMRTAKEVFDDEVKKVSDYVRK